MKNKKQYLFVIAIIILIAAVVLAFSSKQKDKTSEVLPETAVAGAAAQTYAVADVPSLRDGDRFFGPAKAPLKIFVYEDYADPYSARLADTLDRLNADFNGRVVIIVRPFIAKSSALSSVAVGALGCASQQGKWKEMRALLFAQVKNNLLAPANFNAYARQIGLDENKFSACLTAAPKSGIMDEIFADQASYGLLGAPTLFVGEEMIPGARPYEDYTDSNGERIEGLRSVVSRQLGNLGL